MLHARAYFVHCFPRARQQERQAAETLESVGNRRRSFGVNMYHAMGKSHILTSANPELLDCFGVASARCLPMRGHADLPDCYGYYPGGHSIDGLGRSFCHRSPYSMGVFVVGFSIVACSGPGISLRSRRPRLLNKTQVSLWQQ